FIYIYEKRTNFIKKLLVLKNISLTKEIQDKTFEEKLLIQYNKELANVVSKSNIELYIVDYDTNKYIYVNKGGLNALGYTLEEMKKMSIFDINPSLTLEIVDGLKKHTKTKSNIMNITQHQRKDGSKYGVQSLIHTITYNGKFAYVIYDINLSDQQKAQKELLKQKDELLQQAHYDQLTKLPNRVLFDDRLKQAIAKSNRSKKEFAVMFIDLDKFKEINDNYGHKMGDIVLCEMASRFKHTLREEDTVSRFGGDEFVCIIEQLNSCKKASVLAKKLIHKIKEPFAIQGNDFILTCSIGISIYPKDTTDETRLIHHADEAMYKAKDMGKDNYQFYSKC
ncbi:MAG: diguanylate cyclase, partial [Sulfurimonas sp.]|nr:diguanylate cyclase [Sulfurimonas sp.]